MSELEEKFVADDGVSEVPEPTVAAGGEIKKKKADVKKKVDPKADTVETPPMSEEADDVDAEEVVETTDVVEEVVSVEESIASMFEGTDLSEKFKSKVSLVFETAVREATNTKVNEAVTALEEEFDNKLVETVNEAIEEITENLDSYLDYVVEQWMEENKVAVESGIKVEMAESLMDGLRDIFSSHNIDIDEETVDVVAGLEEQVDELQKQTNETINENISLAKEIASLKAEKVFDDISEGLTVSQKERLKSLSEKLDYDDIQAYETDLGTLKESFFKTKKAQVISEETEDEVLTEETETKKPVSQYSSVSAIVEAINSKQK
jgi:hypothetical protein